MARSDEILLRMEHVCKLYGPNRAEAAAMMRAGADKEAVYQATGCTVALWDVNLAIPKGKVFVIIGLSGSGKSTAVRCFNRLTAPTEGRVLYGAQDLREMDRRDLLAYRRDKVSMVFQSFGLMSHRDVLGNAAYGLEVRGVPRAEREKQAMKYLAMVGLEGWEHQSCDQLSGGMRQRVGIARALAGGSEVLLMDEPFSALDPLVRRDMQYELLKIQHKLKRTIVFITHDIDEAFKMGDTVCIMKDGRVVQVGTPEELTVRPADDYVRSFVGGADRTRVVSVSNIMITPSSIVRVHDGAEQAIREMRNNGLSSVVVIDDELRLVGMLSIDEALRARQTGQSIADALHAELVTVAPDTRIADVIPAATEAKLPIAVVDEENVLLGLVTKAAILAALL